MDLSADKIEKCGFQEVNDIGQKDITDKTRQRHSL